jgi:hypothetical protein
MMNLTVILPKFGPFRRSLGRKVMSEIEGETDVTLFATLAVEFAVMRTTSFVQ